MNPTPTQPTPPQPSSTLPTAASAVREHDERYVRWCAAYCLTLARTRAP